MSAGGIFPPSRTSSITTVFVEISQTPKDGSCWCLDKVGKVYVATFMRVGEKSRLIGWGLTRVYKEQMSTATGTTRAVTVFTEDLACL